MTAPAGPQHSQVDGWWPAVEWREQVEAAPAAPGPAVLRSPAARPGAHVIGVLGGRGGAGASTFAAALAARFARRTATVLVDLDRCGAGIDVLLGLEDCDGVRWPDLTSARGDVDGAQVLALLPRWGPCAVLSADRRRPSFPEPGVVADVLHALAGVCGVVVLDLERAGVVTGESVAAACDTIVVLAPRDLRTVAGVLAMRERLTGHGALVGLVAVWIALFTSAQSLMPFGLVVPFAVVVRRYRSANGEQRGALRWLLWAAVVDLLVVGSILVLPPIWASIGLTVAIMVTGAAVAVGVAAPRLVDIDRLLPATVRFAALAAGVVLVDLAVIGLARLMLGDRLGELDAVLVALVVVLAVYGLLRQRLWLWARRIVLGRRDDRYGLVAGLAEELERTETAEEQLLTTARTVAEAFRVRYVGVEVVHQGGGHLIAEHGARPSETHALPITYRGETVGRLMLPARGTRTILSTKDERLLADMVRQAAASARMVYLAQELQASRERIVSAREEERHRLRRDLHDGLGPTLSAVALRIDTARNLIRTSPTQADPVLRTARDDITLAVADVRRLVHDLRPPALDDVGLLAAVRQQGDRLRSPRLVVRIDGDPELPPLSAATEVAAYRIASEALTNVVRHADARQCRVTLRATRTDLLVEVSDDGVGIPDGTPAGVGLISLRERAEELGGRCRIWSPERGGTIVRAELPLPREASND